jgi:hypothetical protein
VEIRLPSRGGKAKWIEPRIDALAIQPLALCFVGIESMDEDFLIQGAPPLF